MAKILKQAAIDIIITIFVLATVLIDNSVMDVVLIIITVLLLLARLAVLSNKEMTQQLAKKQSAVPEWFYHVLNGLNVVFLFAYQRIFVAIGWVLIWFLSWRTLQVVKSKKQRKKP